MWQCAAWSGQGRAVGADGIVDVRATDIAGEIFERAIGKCETQNARGIYGAGKADTSDWYGRETNARIIRCVADEDDRGMAEFLCFFDALVHQGDADAASALVGLHGERS